VLAVIAGSMTASAGMAAAVHTTRVDVATGGAAANASTDSSGIAISAGGRFVVFSSAATNLVPGDTNGKRDVFVRNTGTGVTTRADLGPGGVQANGDSFGPVAISGDGRFVAFESDSSNLVAGSGCSPGQVPFCLFIRDRANGTTRFIKRIANPSVVALSEHGRYLVAQPLDGALFRIDLHTGKEVRVNCCGLGTDFEDLTFGGMSADANLITFGVNAGPSGSGHPSIEQVYVRNIVQGTTSIVSRTPGGVPGNNDSFAGGISPEGRYVIFSSFASNLVNGLTSHNEVEHVYLFDRRRNTIHRIDVGPHGGVANGAGYAIGISAGGRYRVFASHATNLVAGDTNHAWDVFIRDRRTGRTVRVDLTAAGAQANRGIGKIVSGAVAVTPGARWLAFVSRSTNLVSPTGPDLIHTYLRGPLY
jgi:Tol biopolymer transport system component